MRENAQKVTEESALESVVLFIVTGTMLWICRHVKALRRVSGREYRVRYDTRCYFNVRSKADISQLNLPHGTDN